MEFEERSCFYSRLSVHVGLCIISLSVWLPGPMFLLGGLCPGGLCPMGGYLSWGGLCPEGYVTALSSYGIVTPDAVSSCVANQMKVRIIKAM